MIIICLIQSDSLDGHWKFGSLTYVQTEKASKEKKVKISEISDKT